MPDLSPSGIKPPELIYSVNPTYPAQAREAKVEGAVLLAVEIGADGKVKDIEVRRALGFGLDEAAVAAVKRWLFIPALHDNQPVFISATIEVRFRLP